MRFFLGRGFWWTLGAFHVLVLLVVLWFLSMTYNPTLGAGAKTVVLPKAIVGVVLWLFTAGPVTAIALVVRRLLRRDSTTP